MLKLFERAPFPYEDYEIVSQGYGTKAEAYDDINIYYVGEEATSYFDDGKWYIIVKVA